MPRPTTARNKAIDTAWIEWTSNQRLAAIQRSNQSEMMLCGEKIHEHPQGNQRRAEPQRQSVGVRGARGRGGLELVKEHTESGHDKPKTHQRKSRANPRQEGPLRGQRVP